MASITFLGAAGTVTGSKHLLEWHGRRVLLDCGLFQGRKELRLKNREPFPVDPASIDAVILSHAHIDHMGFLPKLVRDGFSGYVYASRATCDLAEIMLRDSAHIQEEDAKHAKKFGYSKHKDPEPLYTVQDVEKTLPLFVPLPYRQPVPILDTAKVVLRHNGHILGSAFVEVEIEDNGEPLKVVYSGDVGRYNTPLLLDPDPPTEADFLLLESTYGDRTHEGGDPKGDLGEALAKTLKRGGTAVIPAFALGRSQQMLFYLADLIDEGVIPKVDVFLDSPMAVSVTWETRSHPEELGAKLLAGIQSSRVFRRPQFHYLTTREQSQKLNTHDAPCVIVSASGMATAGRVLHHMSRLLPVEKNAIIFVGYQAEQTRGRRLIEGADSIKIHGRHVPVKAEVINISSMSGHADYAEMMPWLKRMTPPMQAFMVHGEESGLQAMADRLSDELSWTTHIPALGEKVELRPLPRPEVSPEHPAAVEADAMPAGPFRFAQPGAVAVVLGDRKWDSALSELPGTVVFREEPTEELARRLVKSHLFREVVYLAKDEENAAAFVQKLKGSGIPAWKLMLG